MKFFDFRDVFMAGKIRIVDITCGKDEIIAEFDDLEEDLYSHFISREIVEHPNKQMAEEGYYLVNCHGPWWAELEVASIWIDRDGFMRICLIDWEEDENQDCCPYCGSKDVEVVGEVAE